MPRESLRDRVNAMNAAMASNEIDEPGMNAKDVAVAMTAPPAIIGGGALAYGGHKVNKFLPSIKVDPKIDTGFRALETIKDEKDPGKVMRRYVNESNALLNNKIKYNGEEMAAKDFLVKMRTSDFGQALVALGIQPPVDKYSLEHYDEFIKSAPGAYRQLLRERQMNDAPTMGGFMDQHKGHRWNALKEFAEKGRDDVSPEELAESIAKRHLDTRSEVKGIIHTPHDYAHLTEGALETERMLEKSNPELYRQHIKDTLAAIKSNDGGALHATDAVKEHIYGESGQYSQTLDEVALRAQSGKPDFATAALNIEMAPEYRKATGATGYGGVGKGIRLIRNLKRGAKGAIGLGALGAAAGLGLGAQRIMNYQDRKKQFDDMTKASSWEKTALHRDDLHKHLQEVADHHFGPGEVEVRGGHGTSPWEFVIKGDEGGTVADSGIADYIKHEGGSDKAVQQARFHDAANHLYEKAGVPRGKQSEPEAPKSKPKAAPQSREDWHRQVWEEHGKTDGEGYEQWKERVAKERAAENAHYEKSHPASPTPEPPKVETPKVETPKGTIGDMAKKLPWKRIAAIGGGAAAGAAGIGAAAYYLNKKKGHKKAASYSLDLIRCL